MDIYFWGTGRGCERALYSFKGNKADIKGFIDNDPKKWGQESSFLDGRKIFSYGEVKDCCDLIVVTPVAYEAILYQLQREQQDMRKVVCYFNQEDERISQWFEYALWKINLLEERVKMLEYRLEIRTRNAGYEIADGIKTGRYQIPIVKSGEEAVKRIVEEKCSLIRFGDGEFDLMSGKEAVFQKRDRELSRRLKEVVRSGQEKLLIAIANYYGNLDRYCDDMADGMRAYMTDESRAYQDSVLQKDKVYYDAYMFKNYYLYKNREETEKRVDLVKRIWNNRDVFLIEGEETRTGVGNDLLNNARSVKRLLGPTQDAFLYYNELLNMAQERIGRENLILLALGPAGKVMGYDLVNMGYQVVDIGQLDMDYEWYRAGIGKKVHVPNKYNAEMPPSFIEQIDDKEYFQQIIGRIPMNASEHA